MRGVLAQVWGSRPVALNPGRGRTISLHTDPAQHRELTGHSNCCSCTLADVGAREPATSFRQTITILCSKSGS